MQGDVQASGGVGRHAGVTVATLSPLLAWYILPHTVSIETISYDFANTTLATGLPSHSTSPLLSSLSFFLSGPLCSLCLLDSYRKFSPKMTFLMAR